MYFLLAYSAYSTRSYQWVCFMNTLDYYYRTPTKLREGNVFTCVCLFTGDGVPMFHVTTTHDALDLTLQGPQPCLSWT